MTPVGFVELLNARPAGRDKWMAKCPAHKDASPSLSISVGRNGRTLLNCFAGCSLSSIVAACGLKLSDVFGGPPPTPEQRSRIRARRETENVIRKARRQRERDLEDRVRRLEAVRDALGAKLARSPEDSPDGNEMQRLFHMACDRHRETVTALDVLYQVKEPAGTGSVRIA